MLAIQRSSRAELDLIGIWTYIAKHDPSAADRQLDRIDEICRLLALNPAAGPRREDLAKGLRFYPVGNYLVFYVMAPDSIIVVRVLHGARDYLSEFK